MLTLPRLRSKAINLSTKNKLQGFTLLELLIVLVVISIVTGLIVIRGTPGDSRYLESQAEELGQILRIAHQHALMKSKELRFVTTPQGYVFQEFESGRWHPVEQEPLLRFRPWEPEEIQSRLTEDGRVVPYLTIGPKPGLKQLEIAMQLNRTAVSLKSTSGGRFKHTKPAQLLDEQAADQGAVGQ